MGKYADRKKAYGEAEGPFGFPMQSAVAREVESLWKGLPGECRRMGFKRIAEPTVTVEISQDERTDISLVTTDAVDRDLEVVLPEGGDWAQFLKNPVVTFAHRYDQLPVGRALWVKRHRDATYNGWLAKTKYTDRPGDWEGQWFPDAVWHFVREGHLPGKSIGFLPLEVSAPTRGEVEKRPELKSVRMLVRKWLALEYAVAPVQSNPEALVISAKRAEADEQSRKMVTGTSGEHQQPTNGEASGASHHFSVEEIVAGIDVAAMVAAEIERRVGRV